MELVIMAAGMGSRFGGLKQIEPVHKNGEFIIDYSIYDAIRYGFDKVVFIIKEENYEVFKETIGNRISNKIKVEYVFQKNDNVPFEVPSDRVKPLGTAHAILCCKDVVKDNFLVINSDDFYGRDAFEVASNYLKSNHPSNEFGMVGYLVNNTLTENGSVKRGVCEENNGIVTNIVECSVQNIDGKVVAAPLDGRESFEVNDDVLVSMNMFMFTPKIFDLLEQDFLEFYKNNVNNLLKCEYLIPEVVCDNIKKGNIVFKTFKTTSKWMGITYKEDKESLVEGINLLIEKDEYPDKLWQ